MSLFTGIKAKYTALAGVLFFLLAARGSPSAQELSSSRIFQNNPAFLDSLLKTFSVEELARFKEYYQNEIRLLEKERKLHREKGIHDGEKILALNPEGPFMDKVLFRLAEFYYLKAQDALFKKMEEYEKQFAEFEAGKRKNPPEEPRADYSKVIEKYQLILEKFPHSSLLDDVLYHLAYTYEKDDSMGKAVGYYKQVAERFPGSKNAPEALMRIGEYYFQPERRDLATAIGYYLQVLKYKDTPRYDEALYKLGWCYYLQENFDRSIQFFARLVQDIERNAPLDPFAEYTNPSLKEEALEYMGIGFHDAGGVERALAFIDSLGRPEYGAEILMKIGDIFRANEEKFTDAMLTYSALLERYPFYFKAPEVQEKIVLCARRLEDDQEIYMAQQELFEKYHPGSEWYQTVSARIKDPEKLQQTLENAHQKSEFALRDNINLLIQLGEKEKDLHSYRLAVADAQKYLQTFPFDTSAYTIHWNMAVILDTKLNEKENAYQAYLSVCNDYLQDKFRKYAAQNAIVLAREMAAADTASDSTAVLVQVNSTALETDSTLQPAEPEVLSRSELRLIEAYNNFIKHFPHEEETAVVLGNVGTLYYSNKDFNNALRYFNTLLKRFPDSPTSDQAQLTAMESYFGKRDYASTEIVAKRIRTRKDVPKEFKEKASRRLAESIFLHAQGLAGENEHLKAANEFKRVVEEVPEAVFADKALFQAGVQFDLAKEFSRAIEMYSQVMNRFPKSEHYLDAINNLALDYGELKEYTLAAKTYEKLSQEHSDSTHARDALYNSSYFYVQAKDWRNAIRINRLYVDRYPHASDSEDMFYNMAEYYLKLDDYEHANQIYGEFAAKYPESPRAVETYFKRGDYFRGKGRISEAFREFDLALAKNKELKSKGLEANDFYAAEALFARSEEEYKEYRAIKFTRANLQEAQKKKKDLLEKLVKQYQEVAGFATIRIYEAMYKIGRLYEDFATSWADQELPRLSENEQIVFLTNLNKTSAKLYDRAFESYKSSYRALNKLAQAYHPAEKDTSDNSSSRVVAEDSTLRVASRWITQTGNKVSEMLYRMAELNYNSIERVLNAPQPEGLDEVSALEYRNQVLAKAVFPIVQDITRAHLRNLMEADSLQLNNVWVERSQQRLSDVMSILPAQYKQLCLDALDTYQRKYREYTKIMTQGTLEQKENAIDLAGQLVNIINLSKNYATLMIANYKASLDQLVQHPSGMMIAQNLFADCLTTSTQLARNFRNASLENRNMKDRFIVLNQNDPQMVYEDAIYTYSDGDNFLHDNALSICENAYQLKQKYQFPSIRLAEMIGLMVELDPEKYAEEFQIEANEQTYLADPTWWVTVERPDSGWVLPDYSHQGWLSAQVRQDSSGKSQPTIVAFVTREDTVGGGDAGDGLEDSISVKKEVPREIYLRKEIDLEDIPLSATLALNADDNVWVYLNGIQVFSETKDEFGWGNVFETDLSEYLKPGENVLAIKLEDKDRSGKGIQPILKLKTIGRGDLAQKEQKLIQKELGAIGISDLNDMIFNRYIVPQ